MIHLFIVTQKIQARSIPLMILKQESCFICTHEKFKDQTQLLACAIYCIKWDEIWTHACRVQYMVLSLIRGRKDGLILTKH